MRAASLLGHMAEVHDRILRESLPADAVFRDFFRARRYLGAADRRFVAENAYALLRNHILLDAIARASGLPWAGRAEARAVALAARGRLPVAPEGLDAAAAEVLGDPDVVSYGAFAAGFRPASARAEERIALEESFPLWLVERFARRLGAEGAEALSRALNRPAPVTLRANTLRASREALRLALEGEGIASTPTPRAPDGLLLAKRVNVFSSPSFRAGLFEVQDEGSQLVSVALDPHPDWRVLDACAGAGGKTLHLAAIMRGRGEIFAHEPDPRRREEMRRRVRRAGPQNVRILAGDPPEALRGRMDAVLVDAPCTGTGTIRRNPVVKLRLAPEDVDRHRALQLEILRRSAPYVRPAGLLAYSTCSLLEEENESVVAEFLRAEPGFAEAPVDAARIGVAPAEGPSVTLFPHLHGTDGFFLAHLRRAP